MKVIILHQTVTSHDAIGNDIEKMYQILNGKYECYVYAINQFNTNVQYISKDDLEKEYDNIDNVFVYHHSVYWKDGEDIISKVKGKVVFKYHNITPPDFFKGYSDFHFDQCDLGRKQTDRLVEKFKDSYWLCDSIYNSLDVNKLNKDRIIIVPPFNKVQEWKDVKPNEDILNQLMYSDEVNLLFVSRVAPNKGHINLIEILRLCIINYGEKFHLRIIGKFDEGLPGYNMLIKKAIEDNNLEGYVEFIGEVNDAELLSYYLGSDFYLSYSLHEGFCVPVIEAQYLRLPVIALDACAVKETMGSQQVLLGEDMKEYAAAIHYLYKNKKVCDYLIESGSQNYDNRFSNEKIERDFIQAFNKVVN